MSISYSRLGNFFSCYVFMYVTCLFLSLLSFWDPYNVMLVLLMLFQRSLNCPHFFHSSFCSALVIFSTLSSSLLIHFSVSFILLLIPSHVFFISVVVFFIFTRLISLYFLFCSRLLTSCYVHFIFLLSPLIIFMIITLSSF